MNGDRQVGIAPPALFGFLRLATNRRVLTDPLPVEDAVQRIRRWLYCPNALLLAPGSGHLETAFRLLAPLETGGNLTTDVQIAAYAVDYNGEVHSNDADFGRLEGVPWVNPLRG